MSTQERFLLHGGALPLPPETQLRAGPISLVYQAGDLRYLHVGDREIYRRIYGAVRDRNWRTLPGLLQEESIESDPVSFAIAYTSIHQFRDLHFTWRASIRGASDGSIRFEFDGEALTSFLRNRIGLCLLHPIRECAGTPCRAICRDGTERELTFPQSIADRQPIPGFENLSRLDQRVFTDVVVEAHFEGESFETEDQRNWIDASFKTYGTALSLPIPVLIGKGTRIRQAIEIRLPRTPKAFSTAPSVAGTFNSPATTLHVGATSRSTLPEIGLGCASHGLPLGETELQRLQQLNLSHLRVDLHLASTDWKTLLRVAARDAMELGVPLELAIHFPGSLQHAGTGCDQLLATLRQVRSDLTRILVLQDDERTTPAGALEVARHHLSELGTAIGVGTADDLYQLHLRNPPANGDFVAWSMNPQVHATDMSSLMETPEVAPHQIDAVAALYPDLPLVVSPIRFKPRFHPPTSPSEVLSDMPGLPPQVDPRQLSLAGAGWTLAMLAALAPTRVESLTFFETSGWLGIVETDAGSPAPGLFPSIPGGVFPIYHVFAELAPFTRSAVLPVTTSHPRRLAALALRNNSRLAIFCANLTADPQTVHLSGLRSSVEVRRLDSTNVRDAVLFPERHRTGVTTTLHQNSGTIELNLPAFALARITSQ